MHTVFDIVSIQPHQYVNFLSACEMCTVIQMAGKFKQRFSNIN